MSFSWATAVAGTGTVSCTGTTTVNGTGTNFGAADSAAREGGTIIVGGVTKTIVTVVSTTQLITDTAFGTFAAQAYTCNREVVQTGADTMGTGLGAVTGFSVTNRGDQQRTFDSRGVNVTVNGVLTVDSTTGQLRNSSTAAQFKVSSTGSASAELIINGQRASAANAPMPYAGFDWLGVNGAKVMQLQGTATYPAKVTLKDACIRFGADWLTTNSGQHSQIKTEGEICWILNASGSGTSQARLRLDNNTASINFTAKKTYVGVWLNFGVPQISLDGYTPITTDGPEVNVGGIPTALLITAPNYDSTYVVPSYYAGAQWTNLGGANVDLENNKKGTNIAWFSQSVGGATYNVMRFSKGIKAVGRDAAGNVLNGGYLYFQPVGSNVAGVRAKGGTVDITFDLNQQNIAVTGGSANTKFYYAWSYANTNGLKSSYSYFCSGTTRGAETHPAGMSFYGYDKQPVTLQLSDNGTLEVTTNHASLPTTDKIAANAAAITGATFNFVTKVMEISAALDPDKIYDAYQYAGNQPANLKYSDDCAIIGERTSYTGWTTNVVSGGSIGLGEKFKEFGAALVSISAGGSITIPYQDASGLRVTVTGLDPQAFGITWFLRHRPTGGSTWTTVSGTGNTALILLAPGAYDVQVRAPGYEWESALSLNTAESLSLSAALRYQVSANNTPQYTMAFDAALEAIFQYDATAMKVSVVNATAGILQPGFAELYQATQRIQHIPGLVWSWTAPVTANATSQKILIPAGNPISMFLTDASTNSVKISCPVIHADTGQSADDRVRGNPSGYSIILGSPATAESAGLATQIISGLGGAGYSETEASQTALKALIDQVQTLVTQVKARTDLVPDAPAAVGSAMTLTSAYDAAKTAATQTSVDALATATGTPLQASAYTAPANAGIAAIKAKTDALPAQPAAVGSAMTLTAAYDAAKTAATQTSVDGVNSSLNTLATDVDTLDQLVQALPTLAEIESTTVLAKTTDVTAVPAAVRTELATELAHLDADVSSRSTLTAQDIPEGLTAAEVWTHTTRTLTETPGLTTGQAEQLRKVAQLHGIGAQLVVTETTRTAGDVSQTITTTDDQTTVSAA
jgi:hypothetical protein